MKNFILLFCVTILLKLTSAENFILEHRDQNPNIVYVGLFDNSSKNNVEQKRDLQTFKNSIKRHFEFFSNYEILIGIVSIFLIKKNISDLT